MVFSVKAAHASKPDHEFTISADNENEAVRIVKESGYYPFAITRIETKEPSAETSPESSKPDSDINNLIGPALAQINQVIVGKGQQVKLAVAALLAKGHVLIDDIPGVGKTTFGHAIAKSFGLDYKRIQFTSDLLPSDILGVSIFDQPSNSFSFHAGAIFTQVLLADEINRASAKTQSALLEAMEEQQVTIDGQSHKLPEPFFIIATQNPQDHLGTNALPESQIDRFAVRLVMGYPAVKIERSIWQGKHGRTQIEQLNQIISQAQLSQLQVELEQTFVSEALLDYLETIVSFTRDSGQYVNGLSPRAAITLLNITRAWALIHGREYATPEDMQTVLPFVAAHRLQPTDSLSSIQDVYQQLCAIPIP